MPNRLSQESSPYLLQHQNNPVDWYPWGEEALTKAKSEDKPIFLSIGYAACHWCHVMEHESFEDTTTAALMNDRFINIKVDREERPDLDTIYMNAVVAMTGHGGWPMSVFLTPELEPFYGGTYYPPERRYNMPSFQEVLTSVSDAYRTDRERINEIGVQLKSRLKQELSGALGEGQPIDPTALERASMSLAQSYDWAHGGWGQAPKFPQPMAVEFLIRRTIRGDKMAGSIVPHVLHSMAQGGMYDVVGGGFHRYSVDDIWLVPHFEKMLYDNALLARVYLHGYLLTGETFFRDICTETIDFVIREMTHEKGGFFSSLDADSEGEEGLFYIWSEAELQDRLEDPEDMQFIKETFEISSQGNFEGQIILRRRASGSKNDSTPPERKDTERLKRIQATLLEARSERIRPGTDDKIIASWNGLMLAAISEAARYLNRDDYKAVAISNGSFVLEEMIKDGRLKRAWREDRATVDAFLDDYGALILGLISLYQTDPSPHWYASAITLADEMVEGFRNISGGFFDTRADQEDLLIRPRDIQDNATPSGNSLASTALLTLAAFEGDQRYRSLGEGPLSALTPVAEKYPTAFGQWLSALDTAIGPVVEVALVGPTDAEETQQLQDTVWSTYNPNLVLAQSSLPIPDNSPKLLANRPLVDGTSTAYVCEGFACLLPVTTPKKLLQQLKTDRSSSIQS